MIANLEEALALLPDYLTKVFDNSEYGCEEYLQLKIEKNQGYWSVCYCRHNGDLVYRTSNISLIKAVENMLDEIQKEGLLTNLTNKG